MRIIVEVSEGMVDKVTFHDCPAELVVEVQDYDIDNADVSDLEKNADGEDCIKSEWRPNL